jgi:serine/threonine protein kinase
MRRGLGFKLREAGNGLIDFVTFLEQRKASSITQKLALEWAQQPPDPRPAYWAARLSFVRGCHPSWVLSRGKLRLADALKYGVLIADALAAAHAAGTVHRDLKPGNVPATS